ncbi:MAG: chitobiase/beta-hexosaminidase C-terminal domain-containing protein, partial [Chloroflexi bacterium]|nr:chitobiase/beta-hexosaminidase C-terminal domain-containing protein [Chloroflexota bacterium]
DVYVANDGSANFLYLNRSLTAQASFLESALQYGAAFGENAKEEAGMGTDLGDFDGDGDLDILGTEGEGSNFNHSFVWARNNGSGVFTILNNVQDGDGDFLQGVAVDRFQTGGPLEVALSWHVAGEGIQMLTVPSNPSTETWTWRRISSSSQDEQISSGDIDRDGDGDLLLGTKWLQNDGSSWTTFTLNGTSGKPDRDRLADMNGDGRLDAVVGFEAISATGKVAWYEQPASATGTWTEHVIGNVIGPMSLDVADIDRDGDLDVVVGEHNLGNPSAAKLYVFENADGEGTSWNSFVVYTGDEHHDGTQLVDIDNDGDLDIISIGWGHGQVLLYENKAIDGGGVVVPTVSKPSIIPNGGSFTGPLTVTITTSTSGAAIHYTTDGSEPDTASLLYTGPFALATDATVKTKAYRTGMNPSAVASATFTVTADTAPPTILKVTSAGDPKQVRVFFNEALDQATAEAVDNYSINNGVTVSSASLADDSSTVSLTTSTLSEGVTYTLTVNGVLDLSANAIATNSQETFGFVAVSVPDGLIAYWPFDDGSGSTTVDRSGNGHTGTLVNGPIWVTGVMGQALEFDGIDSYVDAGNIDVTGNGISLTAWFKSDNFANCSSQDCRIISKTTGTSGQDHYWMVSTISNGGTPRLRFRLKTSGNTQTLIASTGDLTPGRWTFVAAVYDGSTMTLYKDGAVVGTMSKTGNLDVNSAVSTWIGGNPPDATVKPWDGVIDDARIYNRGLSATEVQELFIGAGGASPTVVTPAISPNGGSFNDSVTVTITTSTAGATIHYTTDGSDPTTASPQYTGAFALTANATVKARAYMTGMNPSAVASATFALNTVNSPPIAANDDANTNQDTAVAIDVLANDSDVDGDPLTITSAGPAANGAVAINANKTVRYTPNVSFAGTDMFSYSVSDGRGGIDTATVTVTVNAVAAGVLYGDVDGDAQVTFADINESIDLIIGRNPMPPLSSRTFMAADVNGDNGIGLADVNLMMDWLLGLITKFPAEQ